MRAQCERKHPKYHEARAECGPSSPHSHDLLAPVLKNLEPQNGYYKRQDDYCAYCRALNESQNTIESARF